jgi:hypothetical protein
MALAGIGHHGGHAAAVAARLGRQQALHDPARSLEFRLTDAALRYRPAPPPMRTTQPGRRDPLTNQARTAQPGHLAAVVTLETISFGVIPADAQMHAITRCGFILYEHRTGGQPPLAAAETLQPAVALPRVGDDGAARLDGAGDERVQRYGGRIGGDAIPFLLPAP